MAFSFLAMSVGEPGPMVNGMLTWKDILHGPLDAGAGPRPAADDAAGGPLGRGQGSHAARPRAVGVLRRADELLRLVLSERRPSTTTGGLSSDLHGGNVGAPARRRDARSPHLDSTKLSAPPPVGRGRCDIENLTQAGQHRHSGDRLLRHRRPRDRAGRRTRRSRRASARARRGAATGPRRASSMPSNPESGLPDLR